MATTAHSTAPSARKQRAALAYEAVKQWHEPVRRQIRQAVHCRKINHPTGEFLHWLLSQAGDKSYVAIPKAELAALYRKSLSSIKLYLKTGVEQGLLRVSGTRIYFVQLDAPTVANTTTYEQLVTEATALAAAGQILEAGMLMQQAAELRQREQAQADERDEVQPDPAPQVEQPPLFLADDESKNCPDSDNSLSDHPLKTRTRSGGGGRRDKKLTPEELQAIQELPHVQKLKAAGSVVQQCWLRLAERPIAEIDLACKLALNAPWANDPGAVAIWYADQIAAGLIPLEAPRAAPTADPSAAPSRDSPADPLAAIWQQVLSALPAEVQTRLTGSALLEMTDRAVVGVGDVFTRDHARQHYAVLIQQALAGIGYVVAVQVEIGGVG